MIVTSTNTAGSPQRDGRRYVVELHTDTLGAVHRVEYLAPIDANYVAIRNARAAAITALKAEAEFDAVMADLGPIPPLIWQALPEFAARFWARVQFAQQEDASDLFARLCWWLTQRLNQGGFSDNQARTSFNTAYGRSLTAGQWTTLRANRITPAHDRWEAMLSEEAL